MSIRNEIKKIAVIGSTGSVGTQTLDVCAHLGYEVTALAAKSNISLLEEQIRLFKPKIAAVYDIDKAKELKIKVKDTNTVVLGGMEGVIAAATEKNAEFSVISVVGMIGIAPTIAAINAGKTIGLANKETLVCAGELITSLAKKKKVKIIPIDSEHSAIFQSLMGNSKENISKIILTASGGPFFNKTKNELKSITPEDALKHPNWDMGAKITIDCSTLANKGLEFIEAYWLFGVLPSQIEVVIHRESIIHSAVIYNDGSMIAQLGVPDMRIPIQFAITYPKRFPSPSKQLDLTEISKLSFYKPDFETFTALPSFMKAIEIGGTMPAALNAANEAAVELFLNKKIGYTDIFDIISNTLSSHKTEKCSSVEQILAVEEEVKSSVLRLIS